MLLKPLVVAAGALLSVSIVTAVPASAAGYRGRSVSIQTARYAHSGFARAASRRAGIVRSYPRSTLTRVRYAATPAFRTRRIGLVRGIAAYRTVTHTRFARRIFAYGPRRAFTLARRDQLIRSAVDPSSIFTPAATPAIGSGTQVGRASYYALSSRTASGGRVGGATCAHRSLPFGTRILVTNLANAHQMVLTVNDRGPFTGGRILDVSKSAAGFLGMLGSGTAPVRVQVVGRS